MKKLFQLLLPSFLLFSGLTYAGGMKEAKTGYSYMCDAKFKGVKEARFLAESECNKENKSAWITKEYFREEGDRKSVTGSYYYARVSYKCVNSCVIL